jgi:hypothetical protein
LGVNQIVNLIIAAGLSEPPTEALPFRILTNLSKSELKLDVLIETAQAAKDAYYQYMLHRGLLDYTEALITPEEHEEGIRLDTELNFARTIRVKAIRYENLLNVVGQIQFLRGI